MGFRREQLLVVSLSNGLINRERDSFRENLLQQHGFEEASFTSGYPGGFFDATTVQIEGEEANMRMRTLWCDGEFA